MILNDEIITNIYWAKRLLASSILSKDVNWSNSQHWRLRYLSTWVLSTAATGPVWTTSSWWKRWRAVSSPRKTSSSGSRFNLPSGQLLVPPKDLCPLVFIMQVIESEKRLINTLEQIHADAELQLYVPDKWLSGQFRVSRDYLWTVLSSIKNDFVRQYLSMPTMPEPSAMATFQFKPINKFVRRYPDWS